MSDPQTPPATAVAAAEPLELARGVRFPREDEYPMVTEALRGPDGNSLHPALLQSVELAFSRLTARYPA
jgi:hypothetical protein